jgi:hypothetical protein
MWDNIARILLGIAKEIWKFMFPVLIKLGKQVGPEVIGLVTDVVGQAESLPGNPSGDQKWEFAFNKVKEGLLKLGKSLPTRTINLMIEAAVQKLPDKPSN